MKGPETKITLANPSILERAVLYARVSGDDRGNEGRNLTGQLEMCQEYALAKGYIIVEKLSEDDKGATGVAIDLPQLNRIREMAQAGEFDVLIVREIDGLSRSLAKQLIVEEELKRSDVRVEYVLAEYDDSAEGRFQKHIRATVAEYEREKIRERMIRGKRLKVKAGSVLVQNRPPYGYQVREQNGKYVLEIYEPEARIVRLIFQWFTVGDGPSGPLPIGSIAAKLTALGIPTFADTGKYKGGRPKMRKVGEWSRSVVYQMLKNETYAGVWRFAKRDGQAKRNPEEYILTVEVSRIISREVWKAAQARLASNRANSKRNRKNEYLLSGHIVCECGLKMAGASQRIKDKVYLYYRCPATTQKFGYGHVCDLPGFRADKVDTKVWEWIQDVFTT